VFSRFLVGGRIGEVGSSDLATKWGGRGRSGVGCREFNAEGGIKVCTHVRFEVPRI